jgi:hypothetical protein
MASKIEHSGLQNGQQGRFRSWLAEFCSNYYKNSENTHKKKIQAKSPVLLKTRQEGMTLSQPARMPEKANNTTSLWLLFC